MKDKNSNKLTAEEFELISGQDAKNREQRRKRKVNRLFTRKGYYDHLNAIKIVRKKNGKIKHKYVLLERKSV